MTAIGVLTVGLALVLGGTIFGRSHWTFGWLRSHAPKFLDTESTDGLILVLRAGAVVIGAGWFAWGVALAVT